MARLRDILRILATPCDEATELISRARDERLAWPLRAAIRVHTSYCGKCRRFQTQLRKLGEALQNAASPDGRDGGARLSPRARERIAAALREGGESA